MSEREGVGVGEEEGRCVKIGEGNTREMCEEEVRGGMVLVHNVWGLLY